jgi:Fic family protein
MQKLIDNALLDQYKKHQRFTLHKKLNELGKRKSEIQPFAFVVSSVYSSLIEGSTIDIEKYISYKNTNNNSSDFTQVNDLIEAYKFAKTHVLNKSNLLKAHALLSDNFNLDAKYKGIVRDKNVSIGSFFITVYEGADKSIVVSEFDKLFVEIESLKTKTFTYDEVFYYASFIHLMFLKIHPFADGNGRLSRLLEKWFIATHLGENAWLITNYLKKSITIIWP